jgi:hypothetical protein
VLLTSENNYKKKFFETWIENLLIVSFFRLRPRLVVSGLILIQRLLNIETKSLSTVEWSKNSRPRLIPTKSQSQTQTLNLVHICKVCVLPLGVVGGLLSRSKCPVSAGAQSAKMLPVPHLTNT